MSEKTTYKDKNGNVYELVACVKNEECGQCALDNSEEDCLAAPCHCGFNWKLVGVKFPDLRETLWAAVAVCSQMRGSACDLAGFPCAYWVETVCPLRKQIAALGDKKAWRAK